MEVKHLISHSRFPQNEFKYLLIVLYVPLGMILFILRCILLLFLMTLSQIPSDSPVYQTLVNKLACLSFGISITVENPSGRENVQAYISNKLSVFDKLAVHTATGAVSIGLRSNPLDRLAGLGTYALSTYTDQHIIKRYISNIIAAQKTYFTTPEEKCTNGKALLKFKTHSFEIVTKVQPVCLFIERSFFDISLTMLGSTDLHDIFYFMFTPLTNYRLKFLPSLERKSHSVEEFVEIVRQNLANELKVELSDFTANDLIEYEKRKLAEEQMQTRMVDLRQPSINSNTSEIQRMTMQVKEVLPHVPYNAIYKDICTTRSVDTTITNVLEGRLRFTPETLTPPGASAAQPSTSSSTPTTSQSASQAQFSTAASNFPKSATERNRSFQERKDQLIAAARRRYIEKHGLDIPI